ncbi:MULTISPECIES: FKBP-type peptidyl-prolyl cis-trans isomerase [Microbacterium]|uniref:peptidylprolyl isomerase n=1 Tax=Microbacterium aquilitoris TaxID=3067307 RepID=A0ABU3GM20_9MICO|nr:MULTISPECIES: FKBP-type peptidyl-prolyl cis-trans isomerase [unclassified Microbacterium]MDT3331519.1 FKBP-type peptidyl-prolyl cis-trans isomerase [Microbacterium sp. KSW-18]SDH02161.1 peptidylprolyl isomerase [Microbacterium sp. 77mftsu3.1]
MRQIPAAVAVLGLTALALVGCAPSGPSDSGCERVTAPASSLDLVDVTGAEGLPTASTTDPVYVSKTAYTDLATGKGTPITSGMQDLQIGITVLNGQTGQTLVSAPTKLVALNVLEQSFPTIGKALDCARPGARIVAAMPAKDINPTFVQQAGLSESASAVLVIDVNTVLLPAANGVPQYVDGANVPTVVLAPDGTPGIIVPDAAPPKGLVIKTLKKGDGEKITADSRARLQYTGVAWNTGEVFDSTWQNGEAVTFAKDQFSEGFARAIEGQTVGSQVLVVVPSDMAKVQGQSAQNEPPTGTLVYVIDILGIDPTTDSPTATQ